MIFACLFVEIAHKMGMDNDYNMSIPMLREKIPTAERVGIGDDFCMFNVRYDKQLHALEHPCRFDGIMMLYCIRGHVRLSVNLNEYEVTDGCMVIVAPGNILKVTDVPQQNMEDLDYVVVAMSARFGSELKIDLKRIIGEGVALMETPVICLSEDHKILIGRYLDMAARIIDVETPFKDDALLSLVSSMLSIVAGAWTQKLDEMKQKASLTTTRSRMIFEQFIKLVREYHTKHRNVGFYADRLCLTPKYLSKLIKSASGKSAPEWIDSYVILEAKSLLKYSDITIKEIVYRLNFPNQSVFYKFFKARTGMTPSEYRNS